MKLRDSIELVATESLIPYHNNVRIHSQDQINKLASIIASYGFDQPIVVDENNMIIKGHGRWKAAKKLGLQNIPIIRINDLNEVEKNALRLSDNKIQELAGWDFGLLKQEINKLLNMDINIANLGFDINDFIPTFKNEDESIVNELIQKPAKYKINKGDIFILGEHKLVCGDSSNVENFEKLGCAADLVITDPPYNIKYASQGINKKNWTESYGPDNKQPNEYKTFLTTIFSNIKKFLKPNGVYYIWSAWNSYHISFQCLESINLKPAGCIIWDKGNPGMGFGDYRHQYELANLGINNEENITNQDVDFIFYGFLREDKNLKHYFNKILERKRSDVWQIKRDPTTKYLHPTQKPLELIRKSIINSSTKENTILDCFLGSGSTLIASEQLQRKCLGIELDPKFCSIIIERWETFTNKKASLENQQPIPLNE